MSPPPNTRKTKRKKIISDHVTPPTSPAADDAPAVGKEEKSELTPLQYAFSFHFYLCIMDVRLWEQRFFSYSVCGKFVTYSKFENNTKKFFYIYFGVRSSEFDLEEHLRLREVVVLFLSQDAQKPLVCNFLNLFHKFREERDPITAANKIAHLFTSNPEAAVCEYLNNKRKPCMYADVLCLQAASHIFGREVHSLKVIKDTVDDSMISDKMYQSSLFLAKEGDDHFDAMIPLASPGSVDFPTSSASRRKRRFISSTFSKTRGYIWQSVPGDGNCMFHSLVICARAAQIQWADMALDILLQRAAANRQNFDSSLASEIVQVDD